MPGKSDCVKERANLDGKGGEGSGPTYGWGEGNTSLRRNSGTAEMIDLWPNIVIRIDKT